MVTRAEPRHRQAERSRGRRRAGGQGAGIQLGADAQDRGRRIVAQGADGEQHRAYRRGQAADRDAARNVEGLYDLPFHQRSRAVPAQGLRRGELRLLWQDAIGRAAAARPLEARRATGQRRAGRGGRQALCRQILSASRRSADERVDRESAGRLSGAHLGLDLDGRCDAPGRTRQARGVRTADRPSGDLYRLFVDEGRSRRSAGQCDARRRIRASAGAVALPQAGRSHAVGDDPADGECLLQSAGQPDHLPRRDPATALFRSECGPGGQLRGDRRNHRP